MDIGRGDVQRLTETFPGALFWAGALQHHGRLLRRDEQPYGSDSECGEVVLPQLWSVDQRQP